MIARRPFTIALAALIATATGKPCGRGEIPAPVAPATRVDPPYYILYSLDATTSGAPFADENEDVSWVYQLTCVSGPDPTKPDSRGSTDQTEWLVDKGKEAILGRDPVTGLWLHPLVISGAKVICREPDIEPGATNDPADAIITYVSRFRFDLTPA